MTPKTPRQIRVPAALLALALIGPAAAAPAAPPPASQAVDWRDQVLYFAMIDRFADGDPANNDQNAGVFDPADGSKYSGGDLRGITQRLDYIEGLGVTGLWITPRRRTSGGTRRPASPATTATGPATSRRWTRTTARSVTTWHWGKPWTGGA
jgi:hypothetical protein